MSKKGNILQGVYFFFAGLDEAFIEFTLNKCHKTVSQKKNNSIPNFSLFKIAVS